VSTTPAFHELTAPAPTLEAVKAEMQAIDADFEAAPDDDGRAAAIDRWAELERRISTWGAMVHLRFNQDTRNAEYQKARDYRDQISPALRNLANDFKRKLLRSRHRPTLESRLGAQVFALWRCDERSLSPEIETEEIRISRLCADYTELLASASFEFKGENLNLPALGKYFSDSDRRTRHDAQKVRWEWMSAHRERLNMIFHELTALRDQAARKLGLRDFVELGYLQMHRVDYDRRDVEKLRKQVVDEIVPLCSELVERQADALCIDKVMYWDSDIHDAKGSPRPAGDHDAMIERAQAMFDEIGHGLGDFFRMMCAKGLLDMKSRDGKAGGGFCTAFPTYGVPFVFANFNGTKDDVEIFTHEMGHAFQSWSSRHQRMPDYLWPTSESSEIHSMSLEFIAWPWMEKFFGDDADRFRHAHLAGSLLFIPYGTAVDHFQHLVYENPGATPAQRFDMWREMERMYLPWCDYGNLPHAAEGGLWQMQRHIYLYPFYYIDYVLALLCALQFWVRVTSDREAAMRDYVALCARGGEAPFRTLVRDAGLKSPFEPGTLTTIVRQARNELYRAP
jgi:M3 family oligoendopeptidase